jgi:hypothetical protein
VTHGTAQTPTTAATTNASPASRRDDPDNFFRFHQSLRRQPIAHPKGGRTYDHRPLEVHALAVANDDRVAVADVVDAVDGWSGNRVRCGQRER